MNVDARIGLLRNKLQSHKLSAYIIPSSDPHQSEYVADHWKSRAWISGFTGSAGTAVVSISEAGLWTDSRYFIQAEQELSNSEMNLHKVYNQGSPQFIDWLMENLESGDKVGCDGSLFSINQIRTYEKKLKPKGIILEPKHDLISSIWEDRSPIPTNPIFELGIEYAGEDRNSKIKRIRSKMSDAGADIHLISTLDDIAWIFNLRGKDVTYNPVGIAYAILEKNKAILFIENKKVPVELKDKLNHDNIEIQGYQEIWKYLNEIEAGKSILVDENTISHKLYHSINTKNIINQVLPSISMKALKNIVEIQHTRNVMIKDGVALLKFYRWLEENLENEPTEYDLVQKIAHYRSQIPGYQSESFGAIVGYRGNGAIVHYSPDKENSAKVKKGGLLLIDSGGQYLDGTTDITRTISLGDITSEEKNAYTRVLKGNIALDRAAFPDGTLGVQLDTLARIHLWRDNLNYLHGTGHGVGFFLNVHEGPQGFAPGIAARSKHAISEHMITTNEPGYYETGKFGIRIENCLLTTKAGETSSGTFLKFETLTLFPIATDLIDFPLMTRDEIKWLNQYHSKVFNELSPLLDSEERTWLKEKCKEL